MTDYEALYHLMINASEDALAAMERLDFGTAKKTLISAELKAEEMYIAAGEK